MSSKVVVIDCPYLSVYCMSIVRCCYYRAHVT